MEEEILKQCLPHITSTEALRVFANQYNVLDWPIVQRRMFELQVEELLIVLDLPTTLKKSDIIDADRSSDFSITECLSKSSSSRRRSKRESSPEPSSSSSKRICTNEPLSQVEDRNQLGLGRTPYEFRFMRQRNFAKHTAVEKTYNIRFNDEWKGEKLTDLHDRLHEMFDDVLNDARGNLSGNDLAVVVIRHHNLENPIVVPLRRLDQMNADVILSHIENVVSSHQDLALDDSFNIDVGLIDLPKGGGKGRYNIINVKEAVCKKRSIVEIQNEDDYMCLARSLAICFAKTHAVSMSDWQELLDRHPFHRCDCRLLKLSLPERKNNHLVHLVIEHKKCPPNLFISLRKVISTRQTLFATVLCDKASVSKYQFASIADIPKFETVLGCQILVVSAELGNKFLTKGIKDDRKQLFVYLINGRHFHAISSISGFFSQSYFCHDCLVPFQEKNKHECDFYCRVCKRQGCRKTDDFITCPDCNMQCRSKVCFESHKSPKEKDLLTECESWWRCPDCFKVIKIGKDEDTKHDCNTYECSRCLKTVEYDHKCYQEPLPIEVKPYKKRFIMFDFECSQDEIATCRDGYVSSPCTACGPYENCRHDETCDNCHQAWCGQREHRPNFVIAQSVCVDCMDQPLVQGATCDTCGSRCKFCDKWDKKLHCYKRPPCPETCGHREVQFKGRYTATSFCQWLFTKSHKNVTVFAHNFKGYDGIFVLDYLIRNSILPDCLVYNGSKIMYMHVSRGLDIRLMDSLSFFNTSLSQLPKMFHLEELKKGYFPHYFNKAENQTYKGEYPDPAYFGMNSMSTRGRIDFLKWYEEQKDKVFDFEKEMEEYCRSDVQILREALMTFRQLLMSVTEKKYLVRDPQSSEWIETVERGVDPTDYITIASVCHGVYKSKFLKPYTHVKLLLNGESTSWLRVKEKDEKEWVQVEVGQWELLDDLIRKGAFIQENETLPSSIAKVPGGGYSKDQYSKVSIQWLEGLMHSEGIHIQHALNEREFPIPDTKYKADGYCESNNTVYQFDGCLYHGCLECYPNDRDVTKLPRTKQSVSELFALTMKRNAVIREKGYNLVTIWEHEFGNQLQTDSDLQRFLSTLDLQERLDPRDSFFGGRTNASKLFHECLVDEKIRYVDFTSLYPWVNKYGVYPVGHPIIITRNFGSLDQYFGLAKVKIQPPRNLYHPVLPYKSNGKLKFALCRTCADTEQQEPCEHSGDARCFVGTWCIPELRKALDKGYQIKKVYEVYHWEETTEFDKGSKSGGLFADYINTFLKIKQESSGWPAWCKSEEDRQLYISNYLEREGILLDYDKIQKNPGLRALAKLMLNSFWGKYAQRPNMKQTKFVHSLKLPEFYQFLTDPQKTIHDFHILNESVAQFHWTHESEFIPESDTTNIFIATFTTCYARLKLYSVLDLLQERVLYYDTDSVIYVSRPTDTDISLGDYLGDLTDELDGDFIQTFVSGGPKNYAFRTKSGKETCKVRGFSLNHINSQIINFESVKKLILSPSRNQSLDLVNPSKICRDKYSAKIYNKKEKKRYQMVYTKRVIQPNLDTLPFGY